MKKLVVEFSAVMQSSRPLADIDTMRELVRLIEVAITEYDAEFTVREVRWSE